MTEIVGYTDLGEGIGEGTEVLEEWMSRLDGEDEGLQVATNREREGQKRAERILGVAASKDGCFSQRDR